MRWSSLRRDVDAMLHCASKEIKRENANVLGSIGLLMRVPNGGNELLRRNGFSSEQQHSILSSTT